MSDISVNDVIITQNWGAISSDVRMMTALTDTSSPELPHSLIILPLIIKDMELIGSSQEIDCHF